MRRLNFLLLPFSADVDAQQFVVLFEDLSEPGVVKVLVVLEEDEREIELGEREFELLNLPTRQVLLLQCLMLLRLVLLRRIE